MAVIYSTNFDSDTAGTLPTGWTDKAGTSWRVTTTGNVSAPNAINGSNPQDVAVYTGSTAQADSDFVGQSKLGATNWTLPGLVVRINSAYDDGYVLLSDGQNTGTGTGTWSLYRRTSGSFTLVSDKSITILGTGATGETINWAVRTEGDTLSLAIWMDGQVRPTSPGTGYAIWTGLAYTSAGYPGFFQYSSVQGGNLSADNISWNTLVVPVATGYTITGTSPGITGNWQELTVASNGELTQAVTVTLASSASGSFSPATVTLAVGNYTTGTVFYKANTNTTANITGTNDGGLTNPAAFSYTSAAGAYTGTVDNPSLTWSVGNWDTIPVGTYGVATRSKQTAEPGAYLKFQVTGSTDVTLLLDSSISAAVGAGDKPKVVWSIDGGYRNEQAISGGSGVVLLSAGEGGTMNFEVWIFITNEAAGHPRWSNAAGVSLENGVRLTGLTINSGAKLATYPYLSTNTVQIFGDSLTQGTKAGDGYVDDPLGAYVISLAHGMGCQYGPTGFGGQGWTADGAAGATFVETWDRFGIDRPRDFTGLKYFFVNQGTNDSLFSVDPSIVQDAIEAWLPDARAGIPADCWILLAVPPGGFMRTAIIDAMAAYQAASPDSKAVVIDATDVIDKNGFNSFGLKTWASDGVHPTAQGGGMIGGAYANKVNAEVSTGTGNGFVGFFRSGFWG
jgi:lysophospholipase L1-like esterase